MRLNNIEFIVDKLKGEKLPVVMYGTGNGAEKLYFELEKYGIKIEEIFASDNFKSNKTFLGHTVLHFDEVQKKHKDFVVVLGFATDREEMLIKIKELKAKMNGQLFMPEVPVFDNGFFTPEILEKRKSDIDYLFSILADEQSKRVLEGIIDFKISGNIDRLFEVETQKDEVYQNILNLKGEQVYIDAGAFNGDTIREFLNFSENPLKIIAIEPAPKNLEKLNAYASTLNDIQLSIIDAALSDKVGTVYLSDKSGRSPHIMPDGKVAVKSITLDSISAEPTFIKYDVEGEELAALEGSINTITKYKPSLSVSLYHRLEDFIDIPLYINKKVPEYKLYLRHHPYLPSWETNLYATL